MNTMKPAYTAELSLVKLCSICCLIWQNHYIIRPVGLCLAQLQFNGRAVCSAVGGAEKKETTFQDNLLSLSFTKA